MLTVEVIARMEALSAALRKSQQEILSFVSTSNQAIRSLQGTLNSLGFKQSAEGTRQFTRAIKDMGTVAARASTQLNQAKTATTGLTSAQTGAAKGAKGQWSAYGSLDYQIRKLAMTYLSLQAAISSVKYAFGQNIKVDSISTSLRYLLGNADEAAERFDNLKNKANKLGLEYTSLGGAYQLFIGSAKASNYDLDVSEKLFYSLAKAGAVLHLSTEKVSGALYAVQQMMDKGTVQSEELKRQLGNSLPGALAAMRKAVQMAHPELKVTNNSLMEMMKAGKVLSSEVLPYLGDAILENLGIDQVDSVESLQASVGRFSNALTDLTTEGGALGNLFKDIVDGSTYAIESLNGMANAIRNVADNIRRWKLETDEGSWLFGNKESSAELAALRAAEAKAKGRGQVDELKGRGTANGERMLRNAKDEVTAKRVLNEQEAKRLDLMKRINYQLEYAKNNDDNDGAIEKIKALRRELYVQQTTVDTIRAGYNKAYGSGPGGLKYLADDALTSIDAIRKRITELGKMDGSADKGSDIYERIQKLKERLSNKKTRTGVSPEEKARLKAEEDWNKKVAASIEATGKFVLDAIEAQSEAEIAAEKKRMDDLADLLDQGEIENAKFFDIIDGKRDKEAAALAQKVENFHDFVDQMGEYANQFVGDAVGMFAEGIGQMIAGDLSFKDFGKGMLSAMGQFLANFGKQLIAFATASLLFTKLKAAIKAGGATAIPAAIALIGAGIALTVIGSAIQSSMGGNGGSKNKNNVQGFANGVTNFGGGLAMVGERGPELVTLPAGSNVTPAGQTQRMLDGAGAQVFIPEMVIRGEDIYVSFKKTERRLDRV